MAPEEWVTFALYKKGPIYCQKVNTSIPRTGWGEAGMTMPVGLFQALPPIKAPTNYLQSPLNHHPNLVKWDGVSCSPRVNRGESKDPWVVRDSSSFNDVTATVRGDNS